MQHNKRLSHVMTLALKIQNMQSVSRSKALQSAWAIIQNEEVTIHYLVKRYSHERYPNKVKPQELELFKA